MSEEMHDSLSSAVKLGGSPFMVPRSVISPEAKDIPPDPVEGKDARPGLSANFWLRVLKAAVFGAKKEKEIHAAEPVSKQVAREKRKKRVFRSEDDDSNFIEDLDQNIKS